MATLSKQDEKKTLRQKAIKQKKASVKAVLMNPFKTSWPEVPAEKQQKVLEDLKQLLRPLYCKKKKRAKKNMEGTVPDDETENDEDTAMYLSRMKKIKSQYVIGLNAVTRRLEKNRLVLVLVCSSAHPAIITKHIAELCAIRGCPAMALNGLDPMLATALNIRSSIAIGFKKPTGDKSFFKEFISSVEPPVIHVPFLTNDVAKYSQVLPDVDANGHSICKMDTPSEKLRKITGILKRKRKLSPPPSLSPSVPLQELQSGDNCKANVNDGFSHLYIKRHKKKAAKDPFVKNKNFIALGDDDDDDDGKEPLKLQFRFVNKSWKAQQAMWEEIFAMRIMDDRQQTEGVTLTREKVPAREIQRLMENEGKEEKAARLKVLRQKLKTEKAAELKVLRREVKTLSKEAKVLKRKKVQDQLGSNIARRRLKMTSTKIEYKQAEIKRIKGNCNKKEMKRSRKNTKSRSTTSVEMKRKLEKSHLNKKKKLQKKRNKTKNN